MKTHYFGAVFAAAVDKLHADADAAGISMSAICDDAEVSRATPNRYRRIEAPNTVITLERMQRSLEALKKSGRAS
jgi:hypothetical protein